MKPVDVYLPTKLIFGAGSLARLGEEAKRYGNKALIVTTGLSKTDIIPRAVLILKEAGIESVLFTEIEPNPKTYNIDKAVKVLNEENCDFVIGIGGGSAMDSSKAIALVAKNGGSIYDYTPMTRAKRKNLTESLPVICISTTAGTGSEVTMFSVITIPETLEKPGMGYPCMYAKVAIVDPELTVSTPKGVTANVGIDVFFHAMENYVSKSATEFTDIYSYKAMEWVIKYLPVAITEPKNMEARSALHLANVIAGYSITIGTPATLHAMSHAISGITDVPHGRSLAMASVAFVKYTYDSDYKRYADISRLFDPKLNDVPDREAAEKCAGLLKEFLDEISLPSDLKELKLSDSDIKKIAENVFAITTRIANQSLKPMDKNAIMEMLAHYI